MQSRKRGIGLTPCGASDVGNMRHASLAAGSEATCLEQVGVSRLGKGDTADALMVEETCCSVAPLTGQYAYSTKRIISSQLRVPVISIDGHPLMPTKASRARRWITAGKAKIIQTKLGIFTIQLCVLASGHELQPIVVGHDPGSHFSGIGVVSRKYILSGFHLDLPIHVKKSMDKRRELRRNRRYRKCRRRKCRNLNRNGHKIAPSILARKQLELRVITELCQIYPIAGIAMENVAFRHHKKRYGYYFSHVEIGKEWLIQNLQQMASVNLFAGWQTATRRKELHLAKTTTKNAPVPASHVHDAIALCSLLLGDIRITTFPFDIVQRPKYVRRKLHHEQARKGQKGKRQRYGGTATPFGVRKGDYVEAQQANRIYRGWASGYRKKPKLISVSDSEWKRLGQFAASKTRLLRRNSGLLIRSNERVPNSSPP